MAARGLRLRAGTLLRLAALLIATTLFGAVLAQPDGATVYSSNCSTCHQADGQGLQGTFPPLAGVVPRIVAAENGRTTLIQIVLFGMRGEISILGAAYDGNMPAWGSSLSDAQIAAVLNHELTAWGNQDLLPEGFEPIAASEVAAQRDKALSPEEVHAAFTELQLSDSTTQTE